MARYTILYNPSQPDLHVRIKNFRGKLLRYTLCHWKPLHGGRLLDLWERL